VDCCGLLWDRILLGNSYVELFRFLLAWLRNVQDNILLLSMEGVLLGFKQAMSDMQMPLVKGGDANSSTPSLRATSMVTVIRDADCLVGLINDDTMSTYAAAYHIELQRCNGCASMT
jgi:hypothetical protein